MQETFDGSAAASESPGSVCSFHNEYTVNHSKDRPGILPHVPETLSMRGSDHQLHALLPTGRRERIRSQHLLEGPTL